MPTSFGAQIFTKTKVTHIEKQDDDWLVHYHSFDAKGRPLDDIQTVTASNIVLAAGTLGSTAILLRSKEKGLALSDTPWGKFYRQWRHHRLQL